MLRNRTALKLER